jgi:hypothetical protein
MMVSSAPSTSDIEKAVRVIQLINDKNETLVMLAQLHDAVRENNAAAAAADAAAKDLTVREEKCASVEAEQKAFAASLEKQGKAQASRVASLDAQAAAQASMQASLDERAAALSVKEAEYAKRAAALSEANRVLASA